MSVMVLHQGVADQKPVFSLSALKFYKCVKNKVNRLKDAVYINAHVWKCTAVTAPNVK